MPASAAVAEALAMRRQHAFYSHWCVLFDFHLKRLRLSASAFAEKTGRSQQIVHAYLVGRARPPLDQVPIWAAMLGLKGEERERFIAAAQEAHVPPMIWKRLGDLERAARSAPLPPSQVDDRLRIAEAIIAELVGLLRDIEALFFLRTVHYQRIGQERQRLEDATRRAIERYARPAPDYPGPTIPRA